MTRRDVLRLLIVCVPLILLGAGARCLGPALVSWKRLRVAGEEYVRVTAPRGSYTLEIYLNRRVHPIWLEGLLQELDRFVDASTAPASPFGLSAPEGLVRLSLFENREDFERFGGTILSAILENNGGCYSPSNREIALIRRPGEPIVMFPDLRHEAAHMLFSLSSGKGDAGLSPWLSEGLACWHEGQGRGAPDRDPMLREAYLIYQTERRLDIAPLLDATQKAFTDKENTRAYAKSAAIVTYLLDGGNEERRIAFLSHVRAERDGKQRGGAGLEGSLGVSLAALEDEIVAWLPRGVGPRGAPPGGAPGSPVRGAPDPTTAPATDDR